jgi:hypothetical protein
MGVWLITWGEQVLVLDPWCSSASDRWTHAYTIAYVTIWRPMVGCLKDCSLDAE